MGQAFTSGVDAVEDNREEEIETDPRKGNWITKHATWSGLSIVEVERLWLRFKQLGANRDGVLPEEAFQQPAISEDAFVRNILNRIPQDIENNSTTFLSFLGAMKWVDTSSREDKIKAAFGLFNHGKPIDEEILKKILKRVYPELAKNEVEVSRMASLMIKKIGETKKGEINENEFVYWVSQLPRETLEHLFDFHVIPPSMMANEPQSRAGTRPPSERPQTQLTESDPGEGPSQYLTDEILTKVTEQLCKQDWEPVANRLGYMQKDIKTYRRKYKAKQQLVFQLLQDWRDQSGPSATTSSLEEILRQCNLNDTADIIYGT